MAENVNTYRVWWAEGSRSGAELVQHLTLWGAVRAFAEGMGSGPGWAPAELDAETRTAYAQLYKPGTTAPIIAMTVRRRLEYRYWVGFKDPKENDDHGNKKSNR